MKKILLFIIFSFATVTLLAAVRTVSNNPVTIAQFSTIQTAIDASSPGDTIYVHGSPNYYDVFGIVNKRITIIGPGYSPQKNLPYGAVVNTNGGVCDISGTGSSGTEIQGLTFDHGFVIGINVNNLRFIRNWFRNRDYGSIVIGYSNNFVTCSGYIFESNYFDNAYVSATHNGGPQIFETYQNFLFQNNIFFDNITGCCPIGNIGGFSNCVNVLFDHNLWYGPSTGTTDCFKNNCQAITLSNNIFVNRNTANFLSNSSFTNNVTFNAGNNTPWSVNGNIDVGGNIANSDPLMADQVSVNNGINNPLLDFTIATGSANNSGSDGKDMGLLFDPTGSLNWTNSRNGRLPRIFSMNIANPTIQAGATISVSVVAKTSN